MMYDCNDRAQDVNKLFAKRVIWTNQTRQAYCQTKAAYFQDPLNMLKKHL